MIKVEVVERFTLADFKKLKNVKKVATRKENEFGVGDTFECDKEMVDYLTGNNALKKEVVKVIEVKPEIINKDNVIKKLEEAQEEILKDELVETIPVVDKNNVIVDRVVKEKSKKTTKKKTSKK